MIYLVTGFAGSGTSRIAEYLHRGGVPMATAIQAPVPGTDIYFTWTDAAYFEMFHPNKLLTDTSYYQSLINYKLYRVIAHGRHWGLKSAVLILPHLQSWLDELRAIGPVKLIMTSRPFNECQKSIAEHGKTPLLHASRDMILKLNNDYKRDYYQWLPKADHIVMFNEPIPSEILKGT